jgi:hypothetical protein
MTIFNSFVKNLECQYRVYRRTLWRVGYTSAFSSSHISLVASQISLTLGLNGLGFRVLDCHTLHVHL